MRHLLLAAAATAAATLAVSAPARPADACGGSYFPAPQVMTVSTHHLMRGDGAGERRRTFVITGERAPDVGLTWTRLAPGTYDGTQIASAPLLGTPAELTLLGPSGTRVVKLRKRVYLQGWQWKEPTAALEVELGPRDDYQLALWGSQPASWLGLESVAGSERDAAWLAARNVSASAERISVQRVRGAGIEVVAAYPDDYEPMVTFVRRGEARLGQYTGSSVAAAIVQRGRSWLVLTTPHAAPRAVYLGPALGG